MFRTLSEWMGEKNSAYYRSEKTSIHGDFLTYAQSPHGLLAQANATDFFGYAKKKNEARDRKNEFYVLEIGVGEGAFALGFLEKLKGLDQKNGTDVMARTHYVLADFSDAMLERAGKRLKGAGFGKIAEAVQYDAGSALLPSMLEKNRFDLIRCSELFSDVPADLFVMQNGRKMAVMLNEKMDAKTESIRQPMGELENALLERMPEGYYIPFNRHAAKTILVLQGRLCEGGRMDVFDYGFYKKGDFDMPKKMWNANAVREYNGQWTVDLNFLYLACMLGAREVQTQVQEQKEYVEKVMGQKFSLAQDEKGGLDYQKAAESERAADLHEDDFFYHLRIRK